MRNVEHLEEWKAAMHKEISQLEALNAGKKLTFWMQKLELFLVLGSSKSSDLQMAKSKNTRHVSVAMEIYKRMCLNRLLQWCLGLQSASFLF